jgi:hypothetical protein
MQNIVLLQCKVYYIYIKLFSVLPNVDCINYYKFLVIYVNGKLYVGVIIFI